MEFLKPECFDKALNIDENDNKIHREYLNKMKDITRRNSSLILNYYSLFILRYPDGRVTKEEFVENIVYRLISEGEKFDEEINKNAIDEINREKIRLSERLFDICDKDEDGKVDFLEVR